MKKVFPRRELNPGLLGESQISEPLDHVGRMFSPGIEPGTFCVLDRCDNRYTTKTH